MECPIHTAEGADVLIAYGAGRLPAHAAAALKSHLADCGNCRLIAGAQAEVWSVLDSWEPLPVSADFDRKLYARIAAEEQSPWYVRLSRGLPPWTWSFRPAMPLAAACAALLGAFLLKNPVVVSQPPNQRVQVAQARVDFEKVERALDDVDMLRQLGVVTSPSSQGAVPEPM